jgi:hypothetical protein
MKGPGEQAAERVTRKFRGANPSPNGQHDTAADKDRPVIYIDTDEYRVNNEAIAALSKPEAAPEVYQRGNQLVTVLRPPARTKDKIKRPAGTPRISPLPPACLRDILTRVVQFKKRVEAKEGLQERPAHPPEWCVAGVEGRGHWPDLRPLEGVVETPTLRPDGSLLETKGWDEQTWLLYEPQGTYAAVPPAPDRALALAALEDLMALVRDFPFLEPADKTVWLAALLTALARAAVAGPCPLFLFDANTQGTGKSLLADLIALIATGREMSRTVYPADSGEEVRKVITSVALAGDRLMCFDNIASAFGGSALDAALTGTVWKERLLGRNKMTPELPLLTVWFGTGNNVVLKGDARRRVLPSRLETKHEHPEERADFHCPDLKGYVKKRRGELVRAGLTILRAFHVHGRRDKSLVPFGSYEAWSDLIRQAVYWITGTDPCSTRRRLREADPALVALGGILRGWTELPQGQLSGVTVAEALRCLKNPRCQKQFQTLRDALLAWSKDDELPGPRVIGNSLSAHRGQVVDGYRLEACGLEHSVQRWRVIVVTQEGK